MGKRLEISLLGGLAIRLDNKPLTDLVSRKAEALLVYLICNPDKHARELLATLFWDDRTQKQALGNLRVLLNSLRQNLDDFIEITRHTVAFNTNSDYWLDVKAFTASLTGARSEIRAEGRISPQQATQLEEAISYYRGDFLEGFYLRESQGFEEWAILQRERLQRQMLGTLQDLASYYLRRREYVDGIQRGTRLVEMDPLREEGHRLLMRLLARSGKRNAALKQYQTCYKILADELGVEPTEETQRLFQRLKEAGTAKTYHLPVAISQFVGRQEELAEICERFENSACRLLTVVGPGGIGKSWLAAEFARLTAQERADLCPDGVYFISLASVPSEFLVLTIAAALQFSFYGNKAPEEQLINYLRNKEMLLVLDNFEHLITDDGIAVAFLVELLRKAPGLHFLVTSRQSLNLRAEWLLEIEGLEYPQKTVSNPEAWSAVQLFGIAARRLQPDFSLSRELSDVVRICQLVDGMPLGIELAAAWLRGYTCAEIVQQITEGLDFLSASQQDLPIRHRSLRATFEHSWQLLSPREQDVFCRLSIFRGGFNGLAAREVASANHAILHNLTEKSLLQRDPDGRYSLHELLRQYAEEKLAAAPVAWQETATRHAEYYVLFLSEKESALYGSNQIEVSEKIVIEVDNLRAAWRWSLDHNLEEGLNSCMWALHRFYDMRSWFQEGLESFRQAVTSFQSNLDEQISSNQSQELRLGQALMFLGWFSFRLSLSTEATQLLQESEKIFRTLGDDPSLAFTLNALGHLTRNNDAREKLYRESLDLHRKTASQFGIIAALNSLGVVLRAQGRYQEASQMLNEAMEICEQTGNQWIQSGILNNLGVIARIQGDYAQAKSHYQQSCAIKEASGDLRGLAISLNNLGNVVYELQEFDETQKLHQQSLAICQQLGDQVGIARSYNNLGKLAHLQKDYIQAWEFHQQSLQIKNEIEDRWGKAHSLNQLGITAIALDKLEDADEFFLQAMELAVAHNSVPLILNILIGISQAMQRQQKDEQAISILACALSHPAVEKSSQMRGEEILGSLKEQIPPDIFEAAWEKGKICSLEKVTAQILNRSEINEL